MMVKECAVSGMFFPDDGGVLRQAVRRYIDGGVLMGERPVILIAPHAGIQYSGECAGYAYAQAADQGFTKAVVVAPSHYVGFEGVALLEADAYRTPLGDIPLDTARTQALLENPELGLFSHPQPFEKEHALEVHLPFLQEALGNFSLLCVVYGRCDYRQLTALFEACSDEDTLIVVSSDLSHFYTEERANELDSYCHQGIENLDFEQLLPCEACGKTGIQGAMAYAKQHGLRSRMLNYMTSAKHSGDTSRVVGYGSYIIY